MVDSSVRISVELDINEDNLNKSIQDLQKNPLKVPVDLAIDTGKIQEALQAQQSFLDDQQSQRLLTAGKKIDDKTNSQLLSVMEDNRDFLRSISLNAKALNNGLDWTTKSLIKAIEVTSGQQIAAASDPFSSAFRGAIEGIGARFTEGIGGTIRETFAKFIPNKTVRGVLRGDVPGREVPQKLLGAAFESAIVRVDNFSSALANLEVVFGELVDVSEELTTSSQKLLSGVDASGKKILPEGKGGTKFSLKQPVEDTAVIASESLLKLAKSFRKLPFIGGAFARQIRDLESALSAVKFVAQGKKAIDGYQDFAGDISDFVSQGINLEAAAKALSDAGLSDLAKGLEELRRSLAEFKAQVHEVQGMASNLPADAVEGVKQGYQKAKQSDPTKIISQIEKILKGFESGAAMGVPGADQIASILKAALATYKGVEASQGGGDSQPEQSTESKTTARSKSSAIDFIQSIDSGNELILKELQKLTKLVSAIATKLGIKSQTEKKEEVVKPKAQPQPEPTVQSTQTTPQTKTEPQVKVEPQTTVDVKATEVKPAPSPEPPKEAKPKVYRTFKTDSLLPNTPLEGLLKSSKAISDYRTALDKQLKKIYADVDKQTANLNAKLNAGKITYPNYTRAIAQINLELEKTLNELEAIYGEIEQIQSPDADIRRGLGILKRQITNSKKKPIETIAKNQKAVRDSYPANEETLFRARAIAIAQPSTQSFPDIGKLIKDAAQSTRQAVQNTIVNPIQSGVKSLQSNLQTRANKDTQKLLVETIPTAIGDAVQKGITTVAQKIPQAKVKPAGRFDIGAKVGNAIAAQINSLRSLGVEKISGLGKSKLIEDAITNAYGSILLALKARLEQDTEGIKGFLAQNISQAAEKFPNAKPIEAPTGFKKLAIESLGATGINLGGVKTVQKVLFDEAIKGNIDSLKQYVTKNSKGQATLTNKGIKELKRLAQKYVDQEIQTTIDALAKLNSDSANSAISLLKKASPDKRRARLTDDDRQQVQNLKGIVQQKALSAITAQFTKGITETFNTLQESIKSTFSKTPDTETLFRKSYQGNDPNLEGQIQDLFNKVFEYTKKKTGANIQAPKLNISRQAFADKPGAKGFYGGSTKTVFVNPDTFKGTSAEVQDAIETLLHEIAHHFQKETGSMVSSLGDFTKLPKKVQQEILGTVKASTESYKGKANKKDVIAKEKDAETYAKSAIQDFLKVIRKTELGSQVNRTTKADVVIAQGMSTLGDGMNELGVAIKGLAEQIPTIAPNLAGGITEGKRDIAVGVSKAGTAVKNTASDVATKADDFLDAQIPATRKEAIDQLRLLEKQFARLPKDIQQALNQKSVLTRIKELKRTIGTGVQQVGDDISLVLDAAVGGEFKAIKGAISQAGKLAGQKLKDGVQNTLNTMGNAIDKFDNTSQVSASPEIAEAAQNELDGVQEVIANGIKDIFAGKLADGIKVLVATSLPAAVEMGIKRVYPLIKDQVAQGVGNEVKKKGGFFGKLFGGFVGETLSDVGMVDLAIQSTVDLSLQESIDLLYNTAIENIKENLNNLKDDIESGKNTTMPSGLVDFASSVVDQAAPDSKQISKDYLGKVKEKLGKGGQDTAVNAIVNQGVAFLRKTLYRNAVESAKENLKGVRFDAKTGDTLVNEGIKALDELVTEFVDSKLTKTADFLKRQIAKSEVGSTQRQVLETGLGLIENVSPSDDRQTRQQQLANLPEDQKQQRAANNKALFGGLVSAAGGTGLDFLFKRGGNILSVAFKQFETFTDLGRTIVPKLAKLGALIGVALVAFPVVSKVFKIFQDAGQKASEGLVAPPAPVDKNLINQRDTLQNRVDYNKTQDSLLANKGDAIQQLIDEYQKELDKSLDDIDKKKIQGRINRLKKQKRQTLSARISVLDQQQSKLDELGSVDKKINDSQEETQFRQEGKTTIADILTKAFQAIASPKGLMTILGGAAVAGGVGFVKNTFFNKDKAPMDERAYAASNNLFENFQNYLIQILAAAEVNRANTEGGLLGGISQKDAEAAGKKMLMDISGSLAAGFALWNPQAFFNTLFLPIKIATLPLTSAFNLLKNAIMPFAEEIKRVLVQLSPIQTRIKSIADTGFAGFTDKQLTAQAESIGKEFSLPKIENLDAFSKFVAAAKGTRLEGQKSIDVYRGFSTAIRALGLNAEDASLVFLALQQMMSKGKLSAEEVRQQLGEKFPGAITVFAKAMNVSVGEFNRLLESGSITSDVLSKVATELEMSYGQSAKKASAGFVASMTRLENATVEFKLAMVEQFGGAFVALANGLAGAMEWLTKFKGSIVNIGALLAIDLAAVWTAGLAGLQQGLKLLGPVIMSLIPPFAGLYKVLTPFIAGLAIDFSDELLSAFTGTKIQGSIETLAKGMFNMFYVAIEGAKKLGETLQKVWDGFRDIFGAVSKVVGPIVAIFALLKGNKFAFFTSLIATLNGFVGFADAFKGIAKAITPVVSLIVLMIQTKKLLELIKNLTAPVAQGFKTMWTTYKDGSQPAMNELRDRNNQEALKSQQRAEKNRRRTLNQDATKDGKVTGDQVMNPTVSFGQSIANWWDGVRGKNKPQDSQDDTYFRTYSKGGIQGASPIKAPMPATKQSAVTGKDVKAGVLEQVTMGMSLAGGAVVAGIGIAIEALSKAEIYNPLRKQFDASARRVQQLASEIDEAFKDRKMNVDIQTNLDSKGLSLDIMGIRELITGKKVMSDDVVKQNRFNNKILQDFLTKTSAETGQSKEQLQERLAKNIKDFGRGKPGWGGDQEIYQLFSDFTNQQGLSEEQRRQVLDTFKPNPLNLDQQIGNWMTGFSDDQVTKALKGLNDVGINEKNSESLKQLVIPGNKGYTVAEQQAISDINTIFAPLKDLKRFDKYTDSQGNIKPNLNTNDAFGRGVERFRKANDLFSGLTNLQSKTSLEQANNQSMGVMGTFTPEKLPFTLKDIGSMGLNEELYKPMYDELQGLFADANSSQNDREKAVTKFTNQIRKDLGENNPELLGIQERVTGIVSEARNNLEAKLQEIDNSGVSPVDKTKQKNALQKDFQSLYGDKINFLKQLESVTGISSDVMMATKEVERLSEQIGILNSKLERTGNLAKTSIVDTFSKGLIDEPTKNALESTVNAVTELGKLTNLRVNLQELQKRQKEIQGKGSPEDQKNVQTQIDQRKNEIAQAEYSAAQAIAQEQQTLQQSITESYKLESQKRRDIIDKDTGFLLASLQKARQAGKISAFQTEGIGKILDVKSKLESAASEYQAIANSIKDLESLGQGKLTGKLTGNVGKFIDDQIKQQTTTLENAKKNLETLQKTEVKTPEVTGKIDQQRSDILGIEANIKALNDLRSGKLSNPELLSNLLGDYKKQFAQLTNEIATLQNELQDIIINTLANSINENTAQFERRIDLALVQSMNAIKKGQLAGGGTNDTGVAGVELAAATQKYLQAKQGLEQFTAEANSKGLTGETRRNQELELTRKLADAETNLLDKRQAMIDLASRGELAADDRRIKNLKTQQEALAKLSDSIRTVQDAIKTYSSARSDLAVSGIQGQLDAISKLEQLQQTMQSSQSFTERKRASDDSKIIRRELGLSKGDVRNPRKLQEEKDALNSKLYEERASALVTQQKIEQVLLNLEIERQKIGAKMALTEAMISEQKAKQFKLEARRQLLEANKSGDKQQIAIALEGVNIADQIEVLAKQATQIAQGAYQAVIQSGEVQKATQQITQANDRGKLGTEVLINSPRDFRKTEGILSGDIQPSAPPELPPFLEAITISTEQLGTLDTSVLTAAQNIDGLTVKFTEIASSLDQELIKISESATKVSTDLTTGSETFSTNLKSVTDQFGTGVTDVVSAMKIATDAIAKSMGLTGQEFAKVIQMLHKPVGEFAAAVVDAIKKLQSPDTKPNKPVEIPVKTTETPSPESEKPAYPGDFLAKDNAKVAEDYNNNQAKTASFTNNPFQTIPAKEFVKTPNSGFDGPGSGLTFKGKANSQPSFDQILETTIQSMLGITGKTTNLRPKFKTTAAGSQGEFDPSTETLSLGSDIVQGILKGDRESTELLVHELRHWMQFNNLNNGLLSPEKTFGNNKTVMDEIKDGLKYSGSNELEKDAYTFENLFIDRIFKALANPVTIAKAPEDQIAPPKPKQTTGGKTKTKSDPRSLAIRDKVNRAAFNQEQESLNAYDRETIKTLQAEIKKLKKPDGSPISKAAEGYIKEFELTIKAAQENIARRNKSIKTGVKGTTYKGENENQIAPILEPRTKSAADDAKGIKWLEANKDALKQFFSYFPNAMGAVNGTENDAKRNQLLDDYQKSGQKLTLPRKEFNLLGMLAQAMIIGPTLPKTGESGTFYDPVPSSKENNKVYNHKPSIIDKKLAELGKSPVIKTPSVSMDVADKDLANQLGGQIVLNVTNNINGVSGGNTQLVADKITNTIFGKLKNAFDSASQQF